ncbi:MAG: hypothetical protein ABEJ47_05240 [Halorhabdus sp.]
MPEAIRLFTPGDYPFSMSEKELMLAALVAIALMMGIAAFMLVLG